MKFRCGLLMLAAIAALAAGAPSANASGPAWGCGGAPFYPFYAQYGREHIPYFALHPPVYYSYPVARTYGYSPFAYPFGSPTPELDLSPRGEAKPAPKMMSNPFVKEAMQTSAASDATAQAGPKVVFNPFVTTPYVAARE